MDIGLHSQCANLEEPFALPLDLGYSLKPSPATETAPASSAAAVTATATDPVRRAAKFHRVAWLHIEKAGTSFGTTLAHYADASLPANAVFRNCRANDACRVQAGPHKGASVQRHGQQSETFTELYPVEVYFKELLWIKNGNWGAHAPITRDAWRDFRGNFFGMFREPVSWIRSMYSYFPHRGYVGGEAICSFLFAISGRQPPGRGVETPELANAKRHIRNDRLSARNSPRLSPRPSPCPHRSLSESTPPPFQVRHRRGVRSISCGAEHAPACRPRPRGALES